jgi:hypothetical protein
MSPQQFGATEPKSSEDQGGIVKNDALGRQHNRYYTRFVVSDQSAETPGGTLASRRPRVSWVGRSVPVVSMTIFVSTLLRRLHLRRCGAPASPDEVNPRRACREASHRCR